MFSKGSVPFSIAGENFWTVDIKLYRDKMLNTRQNLSLIRQKCSQKTGCGELKRNAQPIMFAPSLVNEGQIPFIKMKIARQLHVIRFCSITTVILFLVRG